MEDGDAPDDLQSIWDTRAEALCEALGSGYSNVWHCPHPFALGGNAEVMQFDEHIPGTVYVTVDLTGTPANTYADYELMICHRDKCTWGAEIVSRLAPYALKAYMARGETMDIEEATPPDSPIKALIFDTYRTFQMYGATYELRLCIGITKDELQYKFDHGGELLLAKLKAGGVYPYTDLARESVLGA
jgi:hypothetical protein